MKIQTDRQKLSVTDINYIWQTQTVCDKNRLSGTKHTLPVTNTYCLLQTQTFSDRQRFSVADNNLWRTSTVWDKNNLSLTDRECLSQTQTVCDNNQKKIFCDRHILYMAGAWCLLQRHTVFTTDILKINKCVSILKLSTYITLILKKKLSDWIQVFFVNW